MAYVAYSNIESPNEALIRISEYITTRGYQIVQPIIDDVNVYDQSTVDGKRFVFRDRTDNYYIILRSANGVNIFGTNNNDEMDAKTPEVGIEYYGIGMTISEGYSTVQRWYNQYLAPVSKTTRTLGDGSQSKDVLGVWIPILPRDGAVSTETSLTKTYTLYCNNIVTPADTFAFTIIGELGDGDKLNGWDKRCVTMVGGNLFKYDDWIGGAFMSASSVPSLCTTAYKIFSLGEIGDDPLHTPADSGILPPLSSGSISNTFLRIDIDDAPSDARGNVRWACSGTDNVTGKPMSLPIRVNQGGNGVVPHFIPLQSTGGTDWGRNINTLNCISLNMPIFMAVRVDPDSLNNYACAGQVTGIYYVCDLNMQSGCVYEQDYPNSNDTCQIFSFSMRRGRYGFDALSIRQKLDDTDSVYGYPTIDTSHTTG